MKNQIVISWLWADHDPILNDPIEIKLGDGSTQTITLGQAKRIVKQLEMVISFTEDFFSKK